MNSFKPILLIKNPILYKDGKSVFQDTSKTRKKDSTSILNVAKKPAKLDTQKTDKASIESYGKAKLTKDTITKSQGVSIISDGDSTIKENSGIQNIARPTADSLTVGSGNIPSSLSKTSIAQKQEEKLPNFFYTEYSKELNPKPKINDADAWILPLLLLSFFFLAILNTFYNREITAIFSGIFKREGLKKIEEQDSNMIWRSLLLFLLLFLIVSPVFMYQTAEYYQWSTAFLPYLTPYLQLLLIGAGLLGIKILMIGFMGNLFFVKEEAASYVTGIVVMNALLAVFLIPVSLAIKLSPEPFTTYILHGGLVIAGLCYLYSVLHGVFIGLKNSSLSKFHLFLYFCTLEILPVFIIIKTVKSLI